MRGVATLSAGQRGWPAALGVFVWAWAVLAIPGPARAADAVPENSAADAAREQRRTRSLAIRATTDPRELENALTDACALDAEVGIPLLRESGWCRVAVERIQAQIDDLSSIPEVRRVDETLRRADVRKSLLALCGKTPTEMAPAFIQLLQDNKLALDDVLLLCDLRMAQTRLATYRKWKDDIEARVKEHMESVRAQTSLPRTTPSAQALAKMDEQCKLIEGRARPQTEHGATVSPEQAGRLVEVLRELTKPIPSQGAEK